MLVVKTILLLFGITALVHSNNMISFYSPKGAEITNQMRGFKHMLEDIGNFEMRDVGDLVLWKDIMPYAVTFIFMNRFIISTAKDFMKVLVVV
ncbi:hypothetical protein DS834_02410 [Lactobacillus bombicola]|uniref:Predicted membrane protein YciQ-like C-terminal domain-containing protein n=1 Tax=Lactobacillus bombicola TaxID=1505723 RepID=A0ABX9LVE0_9LACO|nr:DUF2207 domain-containing protein [Lactobacillus bombicola]RHW52761.1 hypothetical protein DS834_02410 [Lactobacillus bombicola]